MTESLDGIDPEIHLCRQVKPIVVVLLDPDPNKISSVFF